MPDREKMRANLEKLGWMDGNKDHSRPLARNRDESEQVELEYNLQAHKKWDKKPVWISAQAQEIGYSTSDAAFLFGEDASFHLILLKV